MLEYSAEIGKYLRELRGEKTLEEVAMAVGVTRQAIMNYEKGQRVPSDVIKCRLADYFGRSVQEIFYSRERAAAGRI